jgi:hypothetical protein
VFHVQTEDSGVASPHVFTHLFHGGVILSTRKLIYDAGASEDVIRSLMQAQHKATLKELRRGGYDDKIDEYLGSYPDLLPRGTGAVDDDDDGQRDSALVSGISAAVAAVAASKADAEPLPEVAAQRAVTRDPAVTPSSPAIPLPQRPKTGPVPPVVTFKEGGEEAARPARAPTSDNGRLASMGAASLPPLPAPPQPGRGTGTGTAPRMSVPSPPRPAITSPVVVARDSNEQADSSEIYSPPPPSAADLPGAAAGLGADHPGAYSVRRREGTSDPTGNPSPRPSERVMDRPTDRPSSTSLPPMPARPQPAATPNAPRPAPRSPTPAPLPPRSRPTGGVVMSRPAVIVGAPRTTPPPVKGRPTTEEERRGFGQGLISEKSLDEVILAYLSEDANDE